MSAITWQVLEPYTRADGTVVTLWVHYRQENDLAERSAYDVTEDPRPVHRGADVQKLADGVWLEAGGILHGAPGTLSAICSRFGFRNPCRDGRVYITQPKVDRLPTVLQAMGLR